MEGPREQDKKSRTALIVGSIIFSVIVVVSLVLGVSQSVNLPSQTISVGSQGTTSSIIAPSCLVVAYIVGPNGTITSTYTTAPGGEVVVYVAVLSVINGTRTLTFTTTSTSTTTTC